VLVSLGEDDSAARGGLLELKLAVRAGRVGQPGVVELDVAAVMDPHQHDFVLAAQLQPGRGVGLAYRDGVAQVQAGLGKDVGSDVPGRGSDLGVGDGDGLGEPCPRGGSKSRGIDVAGIGQQVADLAELYRG
jgi:hypothetical protein